MNIHVIDGTYELFRQFYGRKRFAKGGDVSNGAVIGVLNSVLEMIDDGATHIGVATDHVIESFRNQLYDGYKTGDGIDPELWAQFHPLEEALVAMGVVTWPMVEYEADDGMATAARIAEEDERVERISLWTPDKDLAQCVRGDRVVQVDRRNKEIRDAAGVRKKFGVEPELIPDFLALVGDAADGFPGIPRIGKVTAGQLLNEHGPIENFPDDILGDHAADAALFKERATLKTDADALGRSPLFKNVDALEWRGPTPDFLAWTSQLKDPGLAKRAGETAARSVDRLGSTPA